MTEPIVLSAHGRRVEFHTADVLDWAAAYDGAPFHAVLTDWPYLLEFLIWMQVTDYDEAMKLVTQLHRRRRARQADGGVHA